MTKKIKAGFWGLIKELAKEAPGQAKELAKETLEGVKSYSENVKAEAHKCHLEHFEKMKKLEKRAKDAGMSEEDLAKFKKNLGVIQEDEGTQRESKGSTNVIDTMYSLSAMVNNSLVEAAFESRIELLQTTNNLKTDDLKGDQIKYLNPLYGEGSSLEGFNQADEYSKKGKNKEAVKWNKKAAEQGHTESELIVTGNEMRDALGKQGHGVTQTEKEAFMRHKKVGMNYKEQEVAEQEGYSQAQNNLGKKPDHLSRFVSPPIDQLDKLRQPLTDGERIVFDLFNTHLPVEWEIYLQPHLNGLRDTPLDL